jgi:hypothetical protein
MKEYNDQVQADADMKQMSTELQSLMRHMHSYATRYNVDLYRSLKENGGKQSADGHGAMSKTKFTSVLLSAFARSARTHHSHPANHRVLDCRAGPHARRRRRTLAVGPMFKAHLLTEICVLYGTGPVRVRRPRHRLPLLPATIHSRVARRSRRRLHMACSRLMCACSRCNGWQKERATVADLKNKADAYAGRLDHPTLTNPAPAEIHMEVKWVAFANDVGEGYMTFPPRVRTCSLPLACAIATLPSVSARALSIGARRVL